jgi:hypothetical protein
MTKLDSIDSASFTADPIAWAMDQHREDWLRVYRMDGCAWGVQPWLELVGMINETLKNNGHPGIWGSEISYRKAEEGFAFRCLYHDDECYAWEEEFYSFLFGWW